jgi:Gas vesicle synthesis protein GvpL/GvpF
MAEYVYGVVDHSVKPSPGDGVAGAPTRLIDGDVGAALVSEISDHALVLGRGDALAHARVLADAMEHGTVLPMRFGVVMEDAEDVRRRLLAAHAEELSEQLELLTGKVEVNVRATYEQDQLMREVLHEDRSIARLRASLEGRPEDATYYARIELGERVAAAVQRKRELDAARIIEALSLTSLGVQAAAAHHERVVVHASFLLLRERLGEFDEVLEALARAHARRIRFTCSDPMPPHSFVRFTQGV